MKKKTHVKTTAFLPLFPGSAPFQTPLSLTSTERIEGTYTQYVTVSLRCSFLLTLFLSSGMAFPWTAVLQENVLLSGFATVSLGISLCSGMGIPGSAVLCHSIFSSLTSVFPVVSHRFCSHFLSPHRIFCPFLAMLSRRHR